MFGLEPTPFDLRLVAFRIPIRVHPSFWVAGIIFGWNPDEPFSIFLWVMCLFVSILIHELGHAIVSEAFGWTSEIVLYWCGGLAFSNRYFNRTPLREMAVALAGPFAGFGLFGLVLGIFSLMGSLKIHAHAAVYQAISYLIFINLFWGAVNLLPVLPLDGGRVCQNLLELFRLRDPVRLSMQVSVAFGAIAAFVFFSVLHDNFAGMLFAMLCLQNLASLQEPQL